MVLSTPRKTNPFPLSTEPYLSTGPPPPSPRHPRCWQNVSFGRNFRSADSTRSSTSPTSYQHPPPPPHSYFSNCFSSLSRTKRFFSSSIRFLRRFFLSVHRNGRRVVQVLPRSRVFAVPSSDLFVRCDYFSVLCRYSKHRCSPSNLTLPNHLLVCKSFSPL